MSAPLSLPVATSLLSRTALTNNNNNNSSDGDATTGAKRLRGSEVSDDSSEDHTEVASKDEKLQRISEAMRTIIEVMIVNG